MPKPALPKIAEFSDFKPYKPSGCYTFFSIATMLFVGIIGGVLVGLVGYPVIKRLVDLSTLVLVRWFWGNLQTMTQSGQILSALLKLAAMIAILSAAIIFTSGGLGVLNGYILWFLAKTGNCRNSRIVNWLTFFSAIIGYSVFAFMVFTYFGEKTWQFYILLGGFVAYIWGTIMFVVVKKVSETPFCEDCEQWLKSLHQGRYSLRIVEPLIQTLRSEVPTDINTLEQVSSSEYPHIGVAVYTCPCCDNNHLKTTIAWEDNVEKGGKTQTRKKEEEWFNILVPADVGIHVKKFFPLNQPLEAA